MQAIVLGSAAGGGFPQWNCGCTGCVAVRSRKPGVLPRTQDSLAVSATPASSDQARDFVLVNASPDVLEQIKTTRALWPRSPRHSPIGAIVLTNGDMDHVLGLFSLRESQPLALYATAAVWAGLEASVFIRTMRRFAGQLERRVLPLNEEVSLNDAGGRSLGVAVTAFPAPGKLPVHLMGQAAASPEDNVGLVFRDAAHAHAHTHASGTPQSAPRRSIAYLTACSTLEGLDLSNHDALLFDGTFYREDELVRQGLSKSVAKDMAHLPIDRSLERLRGLARRVIYTHINNTNPVLDPESPERRTVEDAGIEIAYDGMEIDA